MGLERNYNKSPSLWLQTIVELYHLMLAKLWIDVSIYIFIIDENKLVYFLG
jgi:hypothetical protein